MTAISNELLNKVLNMEDLKKVDQEELTQEAVSMYDMLCKLEREALHPPTIFYLDSENIEHDKDKVTKVAEDIAKNLLSEQTVSKTICRILSSISGDTSDVLKAMIGGIVPLTVTGQISVPWSPLIVAAAFFFITRAGFEAVCKDYV